MRIAIVMFPLTEIGGINSYNWVLLEAWRKMGHTATLFHATLHGRMRKLDKEKPVLIGRYVRLPGEQLAYDTKEDRKVSKNILNGYDLVIFAHQAPHVNIRGEGEKKWQSLYDLKTVVMNIWHDNFWEERIPSLVDVAPYVKVNMLANMNTWEGSAQSYPGYFVHVPIPVDTSEAGLYEDTKKGRIVWLPQWKTWKGIKPFVEACRWIRYPVWLYNSGIDYHYMRRDSFGMWQKSIRRDDFREDLNGDLFGPSAIVKGPRLNTQVPGILKRANISVDLSGFTGGRFDGQTTCVHFESMVYGAALICDESQVRKDSIPEDCCFPVTVTTPRKLARDINSITQDTILQRKITTNALEWVQDYVGSKKIAKAIMKMADPSYAGGPQKKAVLGRLPGVG